MRYKRENKFSWNLIVQDIFPENIIPAGIKIPRPIYQYIKNIFDRAYSKADCLITCGRDMGKLVSQKISDYNTECQINVIENWADVDKIVPQKDELPGRSVVSLQFAGNVGRVQGLDRFLNWIHSCKNENIEFDVWGSGACENDLKRQAHRLGMKNVNFHGSYGREKQKVILNGCDLAIVTLAPGMYGLGVPSKSYNIMAAGKPILFIGSLDSEIALMIKEYGIGYAFSDTDEESIIKFLRGLSPSDKIVMQKMGIRARKVAESRYSRDIILKKYSDLLSKN